jgi:hypothetical protein
MKATHVVLLDADIDDGIDIINSIQGSKFNGSESLNIITAKLCDCENIELTDIKILSLENYAELYNNDDVYNVTDFNNPFMAFITIK